MMVAEPSASMRISKSVATPARLAALFVCLTGMLLAAIGWLGWRLLAQERALDERRLYDQLENTTALAARELDRALSDWEAQLPALTGGQTMGLPDRTIAIQFGDEGVLNHWGVDLPYYPEVRPSVEAAKTLFVEAESLEFGQRSLANAARIYRRLSYSSDETVRAGALMRLARTLRRQGRLREAIRVYDEMAAIGPLVWVAGAPAELVARRERATLFESVGETTLAMQEAGLLADALWRGRSPIDRVTFGFYRDSSPAPASSATALWLARGLETIWKDLRRKENGRTTVAIDGSPLVALWRSTPAGSAALLGGVEAIAPVLLRLNLPGFSVTLENEAGETAWGNVANSGGRSARRTPQESNLPWTVRMTTTEIAAADRLLRSRLLLQIAGFLLMVLVVVVAGVATFRAVGRELSVARLHADFVATVSHEFRTPLTAMSHLAEMLDEGTASPARTPQYYHALVKETRRLQDLVESLLDFGRMDAGRRTYRLEPSPVDELTRDVIEGFADTPGAARIRLDMPSDVDRSMTVHADRQAIGLALRNLVDNALKYSPGAAPIEVSVRRDKAAARISVADEGPGIPAREQKEIFRKFVRGSTAASSRASGTGIGLAIADHIVRAHGGRLDLDSELGRGSRFTMVLPLSADSRRRVEA
jgi:signal transduction histidine kinase